MTLERRWSKPIKKYVDRASELARSPLSLAAVARHIQIYATPVLTYAAMLSAPLDTVMAAEALVWQRALRFPHRSLPHDAIRNLHEIGLVRVRALRVALLAGLARSSRCHPEDVGVASGDLADARDTIGCLASMVHPRVGA